MLRNVNVHGALIINSEIVAQLHMTKLLHLIIYAVQ
jgi:hypothetical protein